MYKSDKPVKLLDEIVKPQLFIFPKEKANDVDPDTRKRAIVVSIGGNKKYYPVEEPVAISFDHFSLFRDIGLLKPVVNFDPVRNGI